MGKDVVLSTEEEEKTHPQPVLKVLTGGKGPPQPPKVVGDWLYTLRNKVHFVARDKADKSPYCLQYQVVENSPDTVCYLAVFHLDGSLTKAWVDTKRFCEQYELIEVIWAPDPEEEEENDSDECDRSD